jgi:uncharacterized phiE125 gp8 family phage protein
VINKDISMTSFLLAGPAVEPVSLAEAKAHLRLDGEDEDQLITTLIAAARIHVEAVTGRVLIAQSWRLVLDGWPGNRVVTLPVGPLIELTAITAYDAEGDAQAIPLAGILPESGAGPARLFLPRALPTPALRERQGLEIDFVAGYGADAGDVPEGLKLAVLRLVAHWFENRDAVILAGSGSIVPPGLDAVLAPWRRVRL